MTNLYGQTELSETLTLSKCRNPRDGSFNFWLYDETRGMNLSVRARTSEAAFVEALTYYQERLTRIEQEHKTLQTKVEAFIAQLAEDDEVES